MRNARVLVVDDDPAVRQGALSWLARPGFEFEVAADGQAAVARIRRQAPDILICDVDMPGLNGFQVLEALRKDPATASISVMLLTRHSSRASVRLGMTLGADDYLTKPFTKPELIAAFEELLSKRARAVQATESLVRRERWHSYVAYSVAAVSLFSAAVSFYLWREAIQDLAVTQRQLDRAATAANDRLPQLLGNAREVLREVVSATPAPVASVDCRAVLTRLAHIVPPGGEVGWVGANGIIHCRSGSQEAGESVSTRPFFTNARDGGGFAAGDYSVDTPMGVPVLTSSVPIKDANGAFLGVAFVSQDIRPSAQTREAAEDPSSKDPPGSDLTEATAGANAGTEGQAQAVRGSGIHGDGQPSGQQSPVKLDLSLAQNLAQQYLILFGVLTGASLGFAGWAAGTFAKWGKLILKIFGH